MDEQLASIALSLCLGIGLSAACGFRVFLPMLIAGLAVSAGHFTPAAGFAWLGSTPALIAFGVATAAEIAAYYIPWLDNALDYIGLPLAIAAGVLLSASAMPGEMSPFLHWTLAAIAGGATAAALHIGTSATRMAASTTTFGCANPLLATAEWILAGGLSILALLLPVLAVAMVLLFIVLAVRAVTRRLRARRISVPAEISNP